MQSDIPYHHIAPLIGQLSVSVEDWEIQLALVLSGEVPNLGELTALHGQTVQVTLVGITPTTP